jgi:hypothetical protein
MSCCGLADDPISKEDISARGVPQMWSAGIPLSFEGAKEPWLKSPRAQNLIIIVKGGENGIGVVCLVRSVSVCITEIPEPLAVRRKYPCEAIFTGQPKVEGLITNGSKI